MTQYQRITGKVFGGNATATGDDPQIAQFGSALANTFVGTTDPATIQQLPAWGQGWIGAVTPDTQFPPLPEMTGAMKVLSHQICGILQQGVSTWDSGTIYYTGNFCSKNGIVYVSLIDENQGNDPETDTTNWRGYGGADIDLSNLSNQGKNIANWSTNVTNCITEIPQRIKLELAGGTLTLKAGSEVIVPNGFEADGTTPKFDYVTIANDLTYKPTWGNGYKCFAMATGNGKSLGMCREDYASSGASEPTIKGSGQIWYDTANNIVKRYNGTSWQTTNDSLFLAEMTGGADGIALINQVFNGMGYIGSTVWVDKGVKGLIPNGRNEDGTLRNIEITTNNVATSTSTSTQDYTIRLGDTGSLSQRQTRYNLVVSDLEQLYKLDTSISYYVYVISENKAFLTSGSQWVQSLSMPIATATLTQGVVSNFQPKQPFIAVDYNDYIADLNTKANIDLSNLSTTGNSKFDAIVPAGTVISSAKTSTPTGYLYCNGAAVSRTTYAKLFSAIGTTYGTGNGSTTFNLPNYSTYNFVTSATVSVKGNGNALGLTAGSNVTSIYAGNNAVIMAGKATLPQKAGASFGTTGNANNLLIGVVTNTTNSGLTGTVSTKALKWYIKY